ncbi:MAG: ABC transporter permease [Bacteroidales bacterium]|nr:ABC transporter permease [Bacteroidales bacterium]MBR4511384.1 ABC transporter permease [Bacteroidales bacterium]MBR6918780.1 ABC transporter permease [Bacteroidales bacterium]
MNEQQQPITKKRLTSAWISTVLSISLVLIMIGLLGIILINARRITNETKENIDFEVILQPDIETGDILSIRKEIEAMKEVKSTVFVSKEQAAKETIELLGHDFRDVVGDILPPSIILKIKSDYTDNKHLQQLEKQLQMDQRVYDVQYQRTYVENINHNLSTISMVLIGISSILLFIAISLLVNTMRLSIYANRFLIRSMLYVGAKRSTIRRPFIAKGIWQGIWGALLAMAVLTGGICLGHSYTPSGNFTLIATDNETIGYYTLLYGILLALGLLFTWLATSLAVRKYIRMKLDNLYF